MVKLSKLLGGENMRLFDTVPDNFFSILSSKNKEIYALALNVLFQSLETEEMSIKKQDFLRVLKETATDIIMGLDLESEGAEDDALTNPTLPSRAAFILRRLEETGWIDIQMNNETFEEYIVLPTYSITILNALKELTKESDAMYNSLVHSTYSELRLEDDEPDDLMYVTLLRAFDNTKKLRIELVTLGHQIKIYQHKLANLFSTNDVLHNHFDDYKVKISDKLYHPLKTFDSVTRFKRPIINILQKWLKDEKIRATLINQSLLWLKERDYAKAEEDLISKINYIQDMYEQLTTMINEIDESHSEYTKSSASKIIYFNNNDKTIKGHLETIFKAYAKANASAMKGQGSKDLRYILTEMQNAMMFHEQGYIDSNSVTLPIIRQYREIGEPLPIVNNFEEAGDLIMQNFLDQTRNSFTDARVLEFMETAFGSDNEIKADEIPLPDYDAFILLILATLKKNDDNCFYDVDISEEGYVHSQGYILPKLTFRRKEKVD